MVSLTLKSGGGSFKMETYLKDLDSLNPLPVLNKYGAMGVAALSNATPKNSGKTANSWYYEVSATKGRYVITWLNRNTTAQAPVAILIQYGHATGNGGYVQGIDYINPALRSIFDGMAEDVWREVVRL